MSRKRVNMRNRQDAKTAKKSGRVYVCHECGQIINEVHAYLRDPHGGAASQHAWCKDCYEREVSRATQARLRQPGPMQKVA